MESIKAYASLPPTPRLSDGSREDHKLKGNVEILNEDGRRDPEQERSPVSDVIREAPPFSLWEYLREELLAADFDSHQELKWERVSNFLSIPVGVEKVSAVPLLLLEVFSTPITGVVVWVYPVLGHMVIYLYNSSYSCNSGILEGARQHRLSLSVRPQASRLRVSLS